MQNLQQQRIQFLRGCQLQPMIRAIDPEVAETGVAVAFRTAHLILGEEDIAVTPDADNRNRRAPEGLAPQQAQIRAVVIEACCESPWARQSISDVRKLEWVVKR